MTDTQLKQEDKEDKHRFGQKEWLILWGILLLYGLLTFTGLGSRQVPQTGMEIAEGSPDCPAVILDMGEQTSVYDIWIYTGHKNRGSIDILYYEDATKQWVPLREEALLQSSYYWSQFRLDRELQLLGISARNENTIFQELVIVDSGRERMLPINSELYPFLFDEQNLLPENSTHEYRTMFDEVFYAGSAYEFMNGMPMYEQTHPPMGKILIAIGEWIFGVNPFGWRFVCAVFGVLLVPLMCYLMYRMFRDSRVALLAAALLSLDFMHFVLSRIATPDAIVAFFILAMFALMWRILEMAAEEISNHTDKPSAKLIRVMLICALATGMGVAVKWTAFYAMAGIALCFVGFVLWKSLMHRKQGVKAAYEIWMFVEGVAIFGLIPLGIYVISFLPQCIATGETNVWMVMWERSLYMLSFHSSEMFDHFFSSPWYTWPWIGKPLLDSLTIMWNGKVSLIATMGHPLLWWSGMAAFVYMLYRVIFRKDMKAGYLAYAYLVMYVPWMFITRTVFIYQYYASSLFLSGMVAYSLYIAGAKRKWWIWLYMALAIFLFVMYYPVLAGYPVSISYIDEYLEWIPWWDFVIML